MVYFKNPHCTHGHLDFLLCYLLGVFTLLCFTFWSVICFDLIYVKGGRSVYTFVVLQVVVQLFQHWRDYLFSILLPMLLCQQSVVLFMWVYFWILDSLLLIYLSIILLIPHCLTIGLYLVFKLGRVSPPICFSSLILFWQL